MDKDKLVDNVVHLKALGCIEVLQCDLDVEQELREAWVANGPVCSIIAEFREELTRDTNMAGLATLFERKATTARKTECAPEYQAYWRGYAEACDEIAAALRSHAQPK